MTRAIFTLILLACLALLPKTAKAYPDLIRHNYVNCNSCHVSPTGGGLLAPYGRAMSNEILSRWGSERETEPLHGLLPEGAIPESLLLGGEVRIIQVHKESPDQIVERGFLMQAGIEVGYKIDTLTFVGFFGEADRGTRSVKPVSPRYYALWNPQEQLSLRAGKFIPVFGINVPYHTFPTRQDLGFGPGTERETAEAVWSGEVWNLGASISRTPTGPIPRERRETLATVQVNRNFLGSYRAGLSYLQGFSTAAEREALGVHGLLGFNEHWAYISEFTFQKLQNTGGSTQNGLFHFSQLLWEATKGVNLYLAEEYSKADLGDSNTLVNSWGVGTRLHPRPHFEFDLAFYKKRTAVIADRYDDYAWLLFHYYF